MFETLLLFAMFLWLILVCLLPLQQTETAYVISQGALWSPLVNY